MKLDNLIDRKDLEKRLGLKSRRVLDNLIRQRKIPYVKLGYRTFRFDPDEVEDALARLHVDAIK